VVYPLLQRTDYLFLIRQLIERGLLGEEEVGTNWPKLSALSWPEVIASYICWSFIILETVKREVLRLEFSLIALWWLFSFSVVGVCREVSAALSDHQAVPSAFSAKPQGHTAGLSMTTRRTRVVITKSTHESQPNTIVWKGNEWCIFEQKKECLNPTIYMIFKKKI